MRVAISRVIELVRPEPALALCEATRDMIVIFRIFVWLFRHCLYLRAERGANAFSPVTDCSELQ
ncbi:MAG: hypothetical protein Udaeo2_24150 [Candidatus Udaeobacter sp.]|nr:MAG: hypothetical protein Udaeo2_24150 [Candidatus Udaeobacter sp.]